MNGKERKKERVGGSSPGGGKTYPGTGQTLKWTCKTARQQRRLSKTESRQLQSRWNHPIRVGGAATLLGWEWTYCKSRSVAAWSLCTDSCRTCLLLYLSFFFAFFSCHPVPPTSFPFVFLCIFSNCFFLLCFSSLILSFYFFATNSLVRWLALFFVCPRVHGGSLRGQITLIY